MTAMRRCKVFFKTGFRLAIASSSLLLSSCMGIKFTYNNLDWLVPWYLDDYVTLSADQQDQFEQQFELLWQWHRSEELPRYADLLTRIEMDIESKSLEHKKLVDYQHQIEQLYDEVAGRVIMVGLDLLAGLSDEQIDEIQAQIANESQEFEEYITELPREKRIKKRIRQTENNFRKWLGPLTQKQKLLIEVWGKEVETTLEHRLRYFNKSRGEFIKALYQRGDKQRMQQQLQNLVTGRDLLRSTEHRGVRDRNRARIQKLLLTLADSLTSKQRQRLLRRIRNYRDSFVELAEIERQS